MQTRRSLLAATMMTAAAVAFPEGARSMTDSVQGLPRIAVIGAGFGGLACAYELSSAGYCVDIFEASNRIGGRVHTVQEFAPEHHVEFGAELIGRNHPHWLKYAERFGIKLDSVEEEPSPSRTVFVKGKRYSSQEATTLEKELDVAREDLNRRSDTVNWDQPWNSPDAAQLDQQSTADWLRTLNISERAKAVLRVELEMDMAVRLENMNFLALLCTVRAHGGDSFWRDSEVYRAHEGNQTLASQLAGGLANGTLHLDCPVRKVFAKVSEMIIVLEDNRRFSYDDVVLAVPPSVWDKIEFNPSLPKHLMPQMGHATKFLTVCRDRFWASQQSADSLTDTVAGVTWEGPASRNGETHSLVGFAGGPTAEALQAMPFADQALSLQTSFEALFPGYKRSHLKSEFVNWPIAPWTRCGYSFPLPSQFIAQSRILREGIGRMHFAGEHASFGFTGYMEGALESGASLALRLIQRDQGK